MILFGGAVDRSRRCSAALRLTLTALRAAGLTALCAAGLTALCAAGLTALCAAGLTALRTVRMAALMARGAPGCAGKRQGSRHSAPRERPGSWQPALRVAFRVAAFTTLRRDRVPGSRAGIACRDRVPRFPPAPAVTPPCHAQRRRRVRAADRQDSQSTARRPHRRIVPRAAARPQPSPVGAGLPTVPAGSPRCRSPKRPHPPQAQSPSCPATYPRGTTLSPQRRSSFGRPSTRRWKSSARLYTCADNRR